MTKTNAPDHEVLELILSHPLYSLAHLDPFQRATTGYHALCHVGWTLQRLEHVVLPCTLEQS